MQTLQFKTDLNKEFFLEEGCHIVEISNKQDMHFSIARARLEVGKKTALHALKKTDEAYYILSGNGAVYQDGQYTLEVAPGDVIYYRTGAEQSIHNTGEEDLIFLCICSPEFRPESYIPL